MINTHEINKQAIQHIPGVTLFHQHLDAWKKGGLSDGDDFLHPRVQYEFPFDPNVNNRLFQGANSVRDVIKTVSAQGKDWSFHNFSYFLSGEQNIIIVFEGSANLLPTNLPYKQQYVAILNHDGKQITHYVEYWNPVELAKALPGLLESSIPRTKMISTTQKQNIDLVLTTFRLFQKAAISGEWDEFISSLDEGFTFWEAVPGPFNGRNIGRERAKKFYEFTSRERGAKLTIKEPYSVTASDTDVMLEYEEEGIIHGHPFNNRIAICYQVENNTIIGSREYIGDLSTLILSK